MKLLCCLLLFLFSTSVFGVSKTITNPQSIMTGAKGISLGVTPVINEDLSNALINPSAVAGINAYPFSITSQSLYGEINYLLLSTGFPRTFYYKRDGVQERVKIGLGFSYGSIYLGEIDKILGLHQNY